MSAAEKRGNSRRTSGGRETRTVLAQQESKHCESNVWTDLYGREHAERAREVPDHDSTAPRVVGQLEQAWALAGDRCRAELAAQVLALPHPIVAHATRDPRSVSLDRTAEVPTVGNAMGSISGRSDEEKFPINSDRASMGDYVNGGPDVMCDYTWVVQAPEASAVLPWANGLFDHLNPSPNEMVRSQIRQFRYLSHGPAPADSGGDGGFPRYRNTLGTTWCPSGTSRVRGYPSGCRLAAKVPNFADSRRYRGFRSEPRGNCLPVGRSAGWRENRPCHCTVPFALEV